MPVVRGPQTAGANNFTALLAASTRDLRRQYQVAFGREIDANNAFRERTIGNLKQWQQEEAAKRAEADNSGSLWGGVAGTIIGIALAIPTGGASLALTAGALATGATVGGTIGKTIGGAFDKPGNFNPEGISSGLSELAEARARSRELKPSSGADTSKAVESAGPRSDQSPTSGVVPGGTGGKVEAAEAAASKQRVGVVPEAQLSLLRKRREDRRMVPNIFNPGYTGITRASA